MDFGKSSIFNRSMTKPDRNFAMRKKVEKDTTVNGIFTIRRKILTGTRIQNNLVELHSLMQFVNPNVLGTKKEFSERFIKPLA